MAERGIFVDHATVHSWVIRYSSELLARVSQRKHLVIRNGISMKRTSISENHADSL